MSEQISTREQNSPAKKRSDSIWLGVVLIVMGFIFFIQQFGDFEFRNWWALFILIPVFSGVGTAYSIWRKAGRFNYAVWSTLYGTLFPLLVALLFLFNMDWGVYWPLFIVLAGFGTLIGNLPFNRPVDNVIHKVGLMHRPWGIAIGLSATVLGGVFLLWTHDLLILETLVPAGMNWWGIFILIPALGGLVVALHLLVTGQSKVLVIINLAGAAAVGLAGVVALFDLNWELMNLVVPVILIIAGAGLLFGMRKGGNGHAESGEPSLE